MSDEMKTTFTPEQISQQAQENVSGILLVLVAYLKEHALSVDEFCAFAGHRFAPGWQQGMTAKEVARAAALNMVSAGVNLRSLSGDESQAEAVLGGWPSEDALAFYGVSQEDADSIWGPMDTIAEHLGFDYEWHRQGEKVTMTFSRRSNE
jgi:hypothetical protein